MPAPSSVSNSSKSACAAWPLIIRVEPTPPSTADSANPTFAVMPSAMVPFPTIADASAADIAATVRPSSPSTPSESVRKSSASQPSATASAAAASSPLMLSVSRSGPQPKGAMTGTESPRSSLTDAVLTEVTVPTRP